MFVALFQVTKTYFKVVDSPLFIAHKEYFVFVVKESYTKMLMIKELQQTMIRRKVLETITCRKCHDPLTTKVKIASITKFVLPMQGK